MDKCIETAGCVSFEFNAILYECSMSAVTKYNHEESYVDDFMYDYYERNCE